jgi:Xaa-Pro dipeptidase
VGGNWTLHSKAIYDIVDKMQKVAIGRTIPGVHWAETHWLAHRVAIRGLLDLGILHNGTEEEIFQAGTSRAFFPHGLGHFIGLECHDVEGTAERRSDIVTSQWEARLHPLDNTPSSPSFTHEGVDSYISTPSLPPSLPVGTKVARVFHPGMALTVEPGVYFCEWIIKEYLKNDIHKKFINEEVLQNYWDVGGVRIEDIVFIEQGGNRVISWEIDAEILAAEGS